MPYTCKQRQTISVGDTDILRVNFTDYLDSGELLASVDSVAEVTTSDLTLADEAVTTATYDEAVTGDTVAIGAGVIVTVSDGTVANSPYRIRITATTDAARVRVVDVLLSFE